MASDLNRVILIGRLTRDPEIKSTSSGNYFCKFTIANNRSYYKKEGTLQEETGFYDCVAWGKLAEVISKYTHKGKRIAVEGSLRFSTWEGQDGKKQSKVEISVENMQFLDAKSSDSTSSHAPAESTKEKEEDPFANANPISDDDIPF